MVSPRYSVITAAELSRNLSAISETADTLVGFATPRLLSRVSSGDRTPETTNAPAHSATRGEERTREGASSHVQPARAARESRDLGSPARERRGRPAVFGRTKQEYVTVLPSSKSPHRCTAHQRRPGTDGA